MRDVDGTFAFVEVRARRGGAAKQQRLVFAARHYLRRFTAPPPCRFDIECVEVDRIEWLRAAFDTSQIA